MRNLRATSVDLGGISVTKATQARIAAARARFSDEVGVEWDFQITSVQISVNAQLSFGESRSEEAAFLFSGDRQAVGVTVLDRTAAILDLHWTSSIHGSKFFPQWTRAVKRGGRGRFSSSGIVRCSVVSNRFTGLRT